MKDIINNQSYSRRDFLTLSAKAGAFAFLVPSFIQTSLANQTTMNTFETKYYFEDIKNSPVGVNQTVDILKEFTDTYKQYFYTDKALCEAMCLKVQWRGMFGKIEDGDLVAGRIVRTAIGFAPQSISGGFAYYLHEPTINELLANPEIADKNKVILNELREFWKTEDCAFKTRNAYPDDMNKILNSDNYSGESGIGFPLYRMSGSQIDYEKLIDLGIPGLRAEIASHKIKTQKGESSWNLYKAMEMAVDTFCDVCLYYAEMAKEQANTGNSVKRKKELELIEQALRNITTSKPETFREGIQLTYLYHLLSGTNNHGRMDSYLGELYAHDVDNKSITEEESLDILISVWKLMNTMNRRWDTRVFLGGKGRRDEKNADRFALLAMEATRRNKDIMPQLSLRFYNGQNPELYNKALDVIGEGCTFPMLYNDDVNIPAVQNAFKVPESEAIHYLPFGCGEYILYHRSFGTPSGVINLLQALQVTLHKGIDPTSQKPMGLPASSFGSFNTFDDLYDAYKKQVEYYVEQLARQEKLEYDLAGETAPFLYFSMVFDDCIKQGKGMFSGGVRYLGGTLEAYGNTNTADSLMTIKDLVYDKKLLTLDEMVKILDADFLGFEKQQKLMLNVPKYGNDSEMADKMKMEVDRHICSFTRDMAAKVGLHSYLIVIINNSTNTSMGLQTAASADGRKAYTYMANGNAPTGGADKNGVTAMLNSMVKSDLTIHAGAVQNMKFSKEMFTSQRPKLEALMKTYWEKGGAQAMITVLGRDDLENAMKYPEKYQNLIVRVGGFSARFVELDKNVQAEILSRMLY